MKITIKILKLRNFKGLKNFDLKPAPEGINIHGDNRTGKTTIAAAFTWLLWGKDLQDRKDFNIKTLDENNNPISQLEHEVACELDVDGQPVSIRRLYQEKWTKRRGEEKAELTGHETSFWWNDVPMKLGEFSTKVKQTFGDEQTFKVLTNPLFFNDKMKWEDRRAILMDIAGGITDNELLQSESRFSSLLDKLTGKTMKEYEAQVKARKKEIKEELGRIPDRLDENDRMRPEEPNYNEVETEIQSVEKELKSLDEALHDKSKALENFYEVRAEWVRNLNELKAKVADIEQQANVQSQEEVNKNGADAYNIKKEIEQIKQEQKWNSEAIESIRKQTEQLIINRDAKRDEFNKESVKELTIDENEFSCPTCKRPYDAEKSAQMESDMLANFNRKQAEVLEKIRAEGVNLNGQIETNQNAIEGKKAKQEELEAKSNNLAQELKEIESNKTEARSIKDILSDNKEYHELNERIVQLQNNEPQKQQDDETPEIKAKKRTLQQKLDELKKQMDIREQVAKYDKRRTELEAEQKDLAQQLSKLEKDEFLIEQFTQKKVDAIESKVNKLFPTVKFKLFEQQLNGGIRETCDTLIHGVPFSAANNAAQIQSGLEIINVLSKYYDISLPIWIDNAESITSFPDTEAQLIKLYVDENFKSLTVK